MAQMVAGTRFPPFELSQLPRRENACGGVRPRLLEQLHQPLRMSGPPRKLSIDTTEKTRFLGDESAQNRIHQATRTSLAQYPRRIHGGMRRCLGCIARVLDLMSADHQQGADFARDPLGTGQKPIDCRSQPQVPPQGTQSDGPDCGALGRFLIRAQCLLA